MDTRPPERKNAMQHTDRRRQGDNGVPANGNETTTRTTEENTMSPMCNHAEDRCYNVDERGHLPAVFGYQPEGAIPSMTAVETLDPREAHRG
jgi:hypothetical protein